MAYTPFDSAVMHLYDPYRREIVAHADALCAVPVRLPGRKRWAVYVAPTPEWNAALAGNLSVDTRSFLIVKNCLSLALRLAEQQAPRRFALLLPHHIPWTRIGRKFRWNCLAGLDPFDIGGERSRLERAVTDYVLGRAVALRERQTLKAS